MKKLLAFVSSIAVCASALAVSILSCFSHPAQTDAESGTPSSLVTTPIDTSGTYPIITFPKSVLVSATSNFSASVTFCPTGWASTSSLVSPSSYGTYSSSFYIDFNFAWDVPNSRFILTCFGHFDSSLAGQSIFTMLNLYNPDDYGGLPSLHLLLSSVSPSSSASDFVLFQCVAPINPSSILSENVSFQLSGLLGVDYEYWRYYTSYQVGHSDGYSDGYSEGHSAGTSEGYSTGYLDGHGVGYDAGYNVGYSAGDSAGYSRGFADASGQFGMWDLFSNAFGSIGNILSIQLFPGLSIGLLLSVPIAFAFILWLIHVLKG